MPDELAEMLRRVSDSLPLVAWPEPVELRQIGQRRSHRRIVAIVVATVLVIAVGAGATYHGGGWQAVPIVGSSVTPLQVTTPPSTPTSVTFRRDVPAGAMLQLADLPAGWSLGDTIAAGASGIDATPGNVPEPTPWLQGQSDCPQWADLNVREYLGVEGIRIHYYDYGANAGVIFETVERYATPQVAATVMDEIKRVIQTCGLDHMVVSDLAPGHWGAQSWTFRARTGDDKGTSSSAPYTVVRQGELIAYLFADPPGRYGPAIAQRLCTVAHC
jgi:hypothetical protein